MTDHRARYGPHNPGDTYVAHEIAEHVVDLGEIEMGYATLGDPSSPALLLIPGQTESWWGYEAVMPGLANHFQVVAAHYEDPPLFSSEVRPIIGPGIRQSIGPMFHLWSTFLGDQWSIGAWDALRADAADLLPEQLRFIPVSDEPPQNLKE
jgi:hypothetical protein